MFVRKPTRPPLPLREGPPLISVFFNSLYDPFGSPCRGQKRCSNRCAIRMADHQRSALVFCAGWDRLAVLLGPLPSGEGEPYCRKDSVHYSEDGLRWLLTFNYIFYNFYQNDAIGFNCLRSRFHCSTK